MFLVVFILLFMEVIEFGGRGMYYTVLIGTGESALKDADSIISKMPADSKNTYIVKISFNKKEALLEQSFLKSRDKRTYSIKDGLTIEPDSIYIIPEGSNVSIANGRFSMCLDGHSVDKQDYLNSFMEKIALVNGDKTVVIVLSGKGYDGIGGIRYIKGSGGIIISQKPEEGRPSILTEEAIKSGSVDFILSAEEIGQKLLSIIDNRTDIESSEGIEEIESTERESYDAIYAMIKDYMGLDLSFYKQSTVMRRIERRLKIYCVDTVEKYKNILFGNENEIRVLCDEMLIGVTCFFRDSEVFEYIKNYVIPELFKTDSKSKIRLWIPGCSTGEEAYSYAILLKDYMSNNGIEREIKIFATDIDKYSLDIASSGVYPEIAVKDIPTDYMEKYMVKSGSTYQIRHEIREMMVFATHNIINDPPFSKIDLISCRNLLIYLQPEPQKKLLGCFHYSLKDGGFLILGTSESAGEMNEIFMPVNGGLKVLKNRKDRINILSGHEIAASTTKIASQYQYNSSRTAKRERSAEKIYKALMKNCMGPCIVSDKNFQIVMVCGDANKYMKIPNGEITTDILKLVDEGIAVSLYSALRRSSADKKKSICSIDIEKSENITSVIEIEVSPLEIDEGDQEYILVKFNEKEEKRNYTEGTENIDMKERLLERIKYLEQELHYTRENLHATIEELEATNEELQAVNEELLSSNEELQSTNEELQSVNEELVTINSEYQQKIGELVELNDDVDIFLGGSNVGKVFLDNELKIRKFTNSATKVINLIKQDVGRPISHISHNLRDEDITRDANYVLNTLIPIEKEVVHVNGKNYFIAIHPYRTKDDLVKGVVITFTDITEIKRANEEIRMLYDALEHINSIVVITDSAGKIEYVNKKTLEVTGYLKKDIVGSSYMRFLDYGIDKEIQRDFLKTVDSGESWNGDISIKDTVGRRTLQNAIIYPIKKENGEIISYINVAERITDKKNRRL